MLLASTHRVFSVGRSSHLSHILRNRSVYHGTFKFHESLTLHLLSLLKFYEEISFHSLEVLGFVFIAMDIMLHFNCFVILFSPSLEAFLHHEFVLSNSAHLFANLNVLSLFRCLVHGVSLVLMIGISQMVLMGSEFSHCSHLLVVMLVTTNSHVSHLLVVFFKVIKRSVLVVDALVFSLHLFISEVLVILLL